MDRKCPMKFIILITVLACLFLNMKMVKSYNTIDSDEDGLTDYEEIHIYHTNPYKESTDGDRYDDGQEILGHSTSGLGDMGGDMPHYVHPPGDNVFVAAYPIIDVIISDEMNLVLVEEIRTETRDISTYTQGYSVANTQGVSYSVGSEESHTYKGWMEVSNQEVDVEERQEYQDTLNRQDEKMWKGYTEGQEVETELAKTSGSEVYAEVEGSVGVVGVVPTASVTGRVGGKVYGEVSESKRNKVKHGTWGESFSGTSLVKKSGESIKRARVRETGVKRGSGRESSFSTTITRSEYHESTVTNSNSIATGKEWATATTINPSHAGNLRFTFYLENIGTDIARNVNDLRFNIFVGNNIPITYPALNDPPISFENLVPGNKIQFSGEVPLTIKEVRDIDEGKSVKIVIAGYSYGNDQLFYENAWGGDVLVEIDKGNGEMERYMTYTKYDENYIDVLKRLNMTVPVGDLSNKRRDVPIILDENESIVSIDNLPVTEWSWWNIYLQEMTNISKFSEERAIRKTRMLLVYEKDSDHDYYTDRIENELGTDLTDNSSHPSPDVIAAFYRENYGGNETVRIKLLNNGNYQAYGIEARMYSSDGSVIVHNGMVGGGGWLDPGAEIVSSDYFVFEPKKENYTLPRIVVHYNDPQGHHSFITKLEISDLNGSVSRDSGEMLEQPGLKIKANNIYTYNEYNWLLVEYENPDNETIENAEIHIGYQNLSGHIKKYVNETVNIVNGKNSFIFWWKPSEDCGNGITGKRLKIVSMITDSEGNFIDDDVKKVKISEYPSWPELIYNFSDGVETKTLTWSSGGNKTVFVDVPKDSIVLASSINFKGHNITNPSLDVGNSVGDKEWIISGLFNKNNVIQRMLNDSSTNETILFPSGGGEKVVFVEIPKKSDISEAKFGLNKITGHSRSNIMVDVGDDGVNDICFLGDHEGTNLKISEFSKGEESKTLNFGPGKKEFTYHINLSKTGGRVRNVSINATPLMSWSKEIDEEYESGYSVTHPQYIYDTDMFYDEKWDTSGYLSRDGCGHVTGTVDADVYENWTIDNVGVKTLNFTAKIGFTVCSYAGGETGSGKYELYLRNKENGNWIKKKEINAYPTTGGVFDKTYIVNEVIPLSEEYVSDGVLETKTHLYLYTSGTCDDHSRTKYYESKINYGRVPRDFRVDTLDDGIYEINLPSIDSEKKLDIDSGTIQDFIDSQGISKFQLPITFKSDNYFEVDVIIDNVNISSDVGTIDVTDIIRDYLGYCTPSIVGLCHIPLKFTSEAESKLEISDINFAYEYEKLSSFTEQINNFLKNCTTDDSDNCQVPFDFSADSAGSLEIYELRIFYKEKNKPPIIESYSPTGNPTLNEGDNMTFSLNKSDPNSDFLDVEWYLDGSPVGSGNSYVYYPSYSSSGHHNITAIITDGTECATHEWNITVNDVTVSKLYVDPLYRKSAVGLENFFDIKIDAKDDIYALQFDIYYDPSLLNVIAVEEGDFFDQSNSYSFTNISKDIGKVMFANTLTGNQQGFSGHGSLAKIVIESIGRGTSDFDLRNAQFSDKNFGPVPCYTESGSILIKSLPGDVNDDCIVNVFDLAVVGKSFGESLGDEYWNEEADLNGDWTVNIMDLATVGINFGGIC